MHQSIPAVRSPSLLPPPPPPLVLIPGISIFFALDGKFPGLGTLELSNPSVWDEKRERMPRPPSTLQHFSLIALSNSAVLSILMGDFFVSINVFLGNSARILIKTSRRYDMHQFSIDVKLLTLKLIDRCKVICYEQLYKYERIPFK